MIFPAFKRRNLPDYEKAHSPRGEESQNFNRGARLFHASLTEKKGQFHVSFLFFDGWKASKWMKTYRKWI